MTNDANTARNKNSVRKKNIATFWLIFVTGFIPVGLAFGAYFLKIGIPEGRTHHGELFQDPLNVSDLGEAISARFDDEHFHIVTFKSSCDEACQTHYKLYKNIHWALGRYVPKVRRWVISEQDYNIEIDGVRKINQPLPIEIQEKIESKNWDEHTMFIVDPYGNFVMAYQPDADGKGVIKDLKKIIKLSKLG